MDDPRSAAPDAAPPFLPSRPPPWIVRGLAAFVIAVFVLALVFAVAIRVPETVASPFRLIPRSGTDPVRAPRGGVVTRVDFRDTSPVEKGAILFVVRSSLVGDRSSELAALDRELAGAREKLANARHAYEDGRRADEAERERLTARATGLAQVLALRHKQQALVGDLVARYRTLTEQGLSSSADALVRELEASRVETDLRESELALVETRVAITKLGHEMAMRATQYAETERREAETAAKAEIRAATLRDEVAGGTRNDLEVTAPCAGVGLRARVRAPGAVVAEGDVLCELACDGEDLQAELDVPSAGAGRLDAGQVVKLLFDGFPYQRYGVRYGTLRWVSPATLAGAENTTFRALVDLGDDGVQVDGKHRPYLAGMAGTARIVIGRRSLLSHAFTPIRHLRESLGAGPRNGR